MFVVFPKYKIGHVESVCVTGYLATFEDTRLRKFTQENKDYDHVKNSFKFDPSDELKPLPGDKARIVRSREERIGLSRRT
ncbi:hypothetical protein AFLA70_312g001462 [Aspergillus flavus AF70]|nr:hypothetical protein AFLA70_312g001462 [Aspergillus flavus AF70]